MRGNYKNDDLASLLSPGSPPRARELLVFKIYHIAHLGITPACAGITNSSAISVSWSRDHPRVRGNYIMNLNLMTLNWGSPPRARELRT